MTETYKCSTCGKVHDEVPLSFAADFPDMYANMKREDRDVRAVIGTDQCVIDQKLFFIRGCLEIPIVGSQEVFLWGLWASVREEVFDEISESWVTPGRENLHGPFKGRIANSLSIYPETFNLRLEIVIQPAGTRPLFRLVELDHPLTIEQGSGITRSRALEMATLLLHQER
jgi:hypothetical protein